MARGRYFAGAKNGDACIITQLHVTRYNTRLIFTVRRGRTQRLRVRFLRSNSGVGQLGNIGKSFSLNCKGSNFSLLKLASSTIISVTTALMNATVIGIYNVYVLVN